MKQLYAILFFKKNFPKKEKKIRPIKLRTDFIFLICASAILLLFRSPSFKLAVGNIAAEKSAFVLNQPGE